MVCYHPLQAVSAANPQTGKKAITVLPGRYDPESLTRFGVPKESQLTLPCGRCIGCRLERSRQWAMRCMHEKDMHEDSCFITLTYDDDHLPKDGSLNLKHFQDFFKRLRKKCGSGIRFFHCGEYGETTHRPHYHAIIFGFDFTDRQFHTVSNGNRLYISSSLTSLWSLGHCLIGDVTFESCAYVARYIMKKVTGELAEAHYGGRKPEYVTMSRKPGIGAGWYAKFKSDVYPSDYLYVNGVKCKPPRFYDTRLQVSSPGAYEALKEKRDAYFSSLSPLESTPDRLYVKEYIQNQRFKKLVRTL